jgi:homopolymeric O-antigen transport system ATP-binding protein
MRPIIRVNNLGKRYSIGARLLKRNFRESIMDSLIAPARYVGRRISWLDNGASANGSGNGNTHVWALKDATLEVMPGEILGVIGQNGAGKSTLLKLLSRITEPTEGTAEIYGRVGSLLEVGTGFHGELTGRENIYLNGAVLGMKRAEIEKKFDEIVAFAEIEKFLETPVKHYSSGMFVRLAFAVAAHLEPEILLADEVLAVGDLAFQKKCLGKMGDVARQGRTVLFVSHNMASIESLCTSCLMIKSGRAEARGRPSDVVSRYMATEFSLNSGTRSLLEHPGRRAGSVPTMTYVELHSADGVPQGAIRMSAPMTICVKYNAQRSLRPVLGVTVRTLRGAPVFCVDDRFCGQLAFCEPAARGTVVCRIERLPLMPGTYIVDLSLGDTGGDVDAIFDAISFDVLPADVTGTGRLPSQRDGPVFCEATWRLLGESGNESGL